MRIAVGRIPIWRLVAAAVAVVSCLTCEAATVGQSTKREEVQGVSVAGEDPRPFTDARELFSARQAAPVSDAQAGELASQLLKVLAAAENLPEGDPAQIGAILGTLDGAVMSNGLYQSIRRAAEAAASKIAKSKAPARERSQEFFSQGCGLYEKGKFADAGGKFRSALAVFPKHLDARNNLGLSEMHAGGNVTALYHFEILVRLSPSYKGAAINLSVAMERLGLSEQAYQTARKVADDNAGLPMAKYNAAWFENARGAYSRAQADLKSALERVPDYARAARLRTLNSMESGILPGAKETQAMPSQDKAIIANLRLRASGKAASRTNVTDPDLAGDLKLAAVTVSDGNTEVFDGRNAAGRLRVGDTYMISETSGDWVALYWSNNGVKRRVWLYNEARRRSLDASVAPSAVVTPQPPSAAAIGPAAPGGNRRSAAQSEFSVFLGVWGEKWGDGQYAAVNRAGSMTISEEAGKPKVTVAGYWKVSDEKFENGALSFRKQGGDSNWELTYQVKRNASGKMELTVRREHDGKIFTGELYR